MKRYIDSIITDLLRRFNLNPNNNIGTNDNNIINGYYDTGFYYTKLTEYIRYFEELIKIKNTHMLDVPESEFDQPFLLFVLNTDGELEVYEYFQHEEDDQCYGFIPKQKISIDDDLIDCFSEKYLLFVQSNTKNRRYKYASKDMMNSLLHSD